ncbi:hypothetical protein KX729_31135 [Rhizobium sp. XQZ8]|uniref:hypothetical protein n=1 Tax=Rhizobium populisoli TaxID=2859785 RepID=UPI001CA48049|nr:hypothetical protein [Rhizobium populisoli]MBW6425847.1 hypothetical protein [Rhizobium populisoli]
MRKTELGSSDSSKVPAWRSRLRPIRLYVFDAVEEPVVEIRDFIKRHALFITSTRAACLSDAAAFALHTFRSSSAILVHISHNKRLITPIYG